MAAQADVDTTVRVREYRVQALGQQDLDRNYALATTHLFKWMQAGRMAMPWLQPGYRALGWLDPPLPRRLVTASQIVRLVRPGVLAEAADNEVVTRCEVGTVGKTSIEFRYKIFFGELLIGYGNVTMIVMAGTPGSLKPSPVPEVIRALGSPEPDETRQLMADALAALPKAPPGDAHINTVVVRYSDEDLNKHANHSTMARFFEDAKETIAADEGAKPDVRTIAQQQLEAIVISYHAEIRATDELRVSVATSTPGALDVWVHRRTSNPSGGKPTLVGRGRMVCGGGRVLDSETLRLKSNL